MDRGGLNLRGHTFSKLRKTNPRKASEPRQRCSCMDNNQSPELFQRGHHASNAWADQMVAARTALEESGVWTANPSLRNEQTRAWHEKVKVDFCDVEFRSLAKHRHFRLPRSALFRGAHFPTRLTRNRGSGSIWSLVPKGGLRALRTSYRSRLARSIPSARFQIGKTSQRGFTIRTL